MKAKNKYPIFVPSKGRSEHCTTMLALEKMGADYKAVVEEPEYDLYAARLGEHRLLVLPHKDEGLVVTRNWIWDYAQYELGVPYFWTFDDNIRGIYRYNHNLLTPCFTLAPLQAIEDFTERYENVVISGMTYFMFVSRKCVYPAFNPNRRVYSNMLINTSSKNSKGEYYRNEGFYNDDTDLCLRVLKDGNCTILFNAFLIDKITTMVLKGGMTTHYVEQDDGTEGLEKDGRWRMAEELRQKHPDVTTITRKWGRWQHHVDYRPFAGNLLKRKEGIEIPEGTNEYGMKLEYLKDVDTGFEPPEELTSEEREFIQEQIDLF